jgi:hypothetical protein
VSCFDGYMLMTDSTKTVERMYWSSNNVVD